MKKLFMWLLGVVSLSMLQIFADTEVVGNVEWVYHHVWDDNDENVIGVAVYGVQSTETETYETYSRYYGWQTYTRKRTLEGSLAIPSRLGGYDVVQIGDSYPNNGYGYNEGARFYNTAVTEIKIPNTVIRVNRNMFVDVNSSDFSGCIDFDTIPGVGLVDGWVVCVECDAPEELDLSRMRGIAAGAFSGKYFDSYGAGHGDEEYVNVKSVVLPEGAKEVWPYAFYYCKSLQSVTIPDSVTKIGRYAFCECEALSNITLPSGLDEIDTRAFCQSGLTSISLPGKLQSIRSSAFRYCDSLTGIVVPSSVTYLGYLAFDLCDNLKTVTLPKWCKTMNCYWNDNHGEWEYFKGNQKALEKKIGRSLSGEDEFVNFVNFLFVSHDGEDYAHVVKRIKITYKDVSGAGGGAVPEAWQKARTLKGKATRALASPVVGIFELKCGKANKQGVAKVSATLTGLDGKKKSYKAQSVDVGGKTATVNLDGLSVTIEGDSFLGGDGLAGGLSVSTAVVGGDWTRGGAKVYVDAAVADLPAGTIEALLPGGEPVIAKGGKWAFNKAATVKLSSDKSNAEWDTAKGKTNLSGIKLSYTPKKGLFKGSFKVYALEGADGAKKLKKYTANVTGVVVDGNGVGQAFIKKPAVGPWIVTVE